MATGWEPGTPHMGLIASIAKRLGIGRVPSAFAPPPKESAADKIIAFLQGWQRSNIATTYTLQRIDQVAAFRGWPYVAIDARCSESACLTPKVCRIVDGEQVESDYRKSLYAAKSLGERDWVRAQRRRKYLTKSMRRKALAHVQDSDEMEQVSSKHPLVKLLQNPNGPDVAYTLSYRMHLYLRLTGVTYLWVVNNVLGKPCQLWCLPSHWVYEFPTDAHGQPTEKLVGSYEIRPQNVTSPLDYGFGWFPGAGGRKRVDESEIIKIAYVNPQSLTDGYSPVGATSAWTDVSNAIDSSRVQALQNGAYPGVVLELDKEMTAPDMPALQRIFDRFSEKVAGVRNSRKPYVLAPGMKLAPSPYQSSVEMDHVNGATQIRDFQMAAHRVGPTIAGITEQTSFAADTAARMGFYHGTLRPDLMFIGQVLTEKLASRFEDDLCIWWDDPTPDDPDYKLKAAESLNRMSANTPNEIREDFGKEPFEFGGDDPMGSMGQQPLPWATGEQPAMMPGMDGGQFPPEGGGQGDNAMDSVMGELLGGAGGDGASETSGLPTPLKDRLANGNGKAATNGAH